MPEPDDEAAELAAIRAAQRDATAKALARIRSRAETARAQGRQAEYAESATEDVLRLLGVVDAALAVAREWAAKALVMRAALRHDDHSNAPTIAARAMIAAGRQTGADELRAAIARELTGKGAGGARARHDPECPGCESCDQYHTGRVLDFEVLGEADHG
jgi:hypothetical protein